VFLAGLTSYQKQVLAILTVLNFLNYVDRQIVYALVPLIKAEFVLTNFQVALLGTVFSIVHSLAALPLGLLADRVSRRKIILYGSFFWSLATFVSGLATSFRSLLQIRALVGLGEAAYAPAATAILSASFLRELRARVQGIFFTGMFIGGSAGLALGGILAEWWGWRAAFFVVGVPGLILALATLRLPEPPPLRDAPKPVRIRTLLRDPAYVMTVAGGWFMAFAAYSYIFWGTEFISRYKGFGLAEAGIVLGVSLAVAGVLGILAGAWIADHLTRRVAWGHVSVVGMGVLLGTPLLFAAVHASGRATFVALFFLACFFMSWYHGPLTATFHHLVPDSTHASAVGFYYFFVNLFAVTIAPPVLGRLADRFDLLTALHVPMVAQLLAAGCFFAVAYRIHRQGRPAVPTVVSLAEG
jgi:predicted MFS family arabinose efflux permease